MLVAIGLLRVESSFLGLQRGWQKVVDASCLRLHGLIACLLRLQRLEWCSRGISKGAGSHLTIHELLLRIVTCRLIVHLAHLTETSLLRVHEASLLRIHLTHSTLLIELSKTLTGRCKLWQIASHLWSQWWRRINAALLILRCRDRSLRWRR